MGGGHRFPYPKWVWSPSGGWWPVVPNWKRNTAIYCVGMAGVLYMAYLYAEPRTVCPSLLFFYQFGDNSL